MNKYLLIDFFVFIIESLKASGSKICFLKEIAYQSLKTDLNTNTLDESLMESMLKM